MDNMKQWDVIYLEDGDPVRQTFRCWADCGIHAVDQCRDAEPKATLIRADLTVDTVPVALTKPQIAMLRSLVYHERKAYADGAGQADFLDELADQLEQAEGV